MKTTRKALVMSFLAILVCCAMLVGSTYAWFTDTASTGVNKIVAGKLDVELNVLVDGEYVDATDENVKLFNEIELWEPGVVGVEKFQAVNAGDLALKYDLYIEVAGMNSLNGKTLAEVVKVAVTTDDLTGMNRAQVIEAVKDDLKPFNSSLAYFIGETLEVGDDQEFTVVAYWEPSASDNDYNANNGKQTSDGAALYIDFGVTLAATQAMSEGDSFGTDYDEDAKLGGLYAVTAAINKGIGDSNAAIAAAAGEGVIYFDDAMTKTADGEYAITLHFEEGSIDFINETYNAVKALIGAAVNENASEIKSIKIATAPVRELNGQPIEAVEGDAGWWVEADLKTVVNGVGGLMQALEAAPKEGLPVYITDMNGNVQTYKMVFDLYWVVTGIDAVTAAVEQGIVDSNNALNAATNGTIWFDDALTVTDDGYSITLHFEKGGEAYVNEAYNEVKALIAAAVVENASEIQTINIAGTGDVTSDNFDANGDWVEAALKQAVGGAGGFQQALEAAAEYGLPVVITDVNGNALTYTMYFEINWN